MSDENNHVRVFREGKLKPSESILGHLDGWIGEMMGSGDKRQHNGSFILTSERVCFYRKGIFGEVFETIPLSKITSVETLSRLGYRVVRLHTSHDELAFKTFAAKSEFDSLYEQLEALRHSPQAATLPQGESLTDQIRKLGELRDDGILTEEEFSSKKAQLLARF